MPLRSLRYFLVAAEEMNFRKAAERLDITQQSLSSSIQKLERQYGAAFFERKPRLILTPAGRSMVEYVRKVLHTEQQLVAALADTSRTSTGSLRVGVTGTRGAVFMPRIWDVYHRQFPNIVVTTVEASTAELDELLRDGKIDLYIGVNVPRHNNMQVLTFMRDRIYCAFSRRFLAKSPPAWREALLDPHGFDLTKIDSMPLITFTHSNGLRYTLERFFEKQDIHPNIIFETSRHDLALNLCRQEHGIGLVYEMILYDALRRPDIANELYAVPVRAELPQKNTELTYRMESFHPRYLQGFIQVAQAVFEQYSKTIGAVIRRAQK